MKTCDHLRAEHEKIGLSLSVGGYLRGTAASAISAYERGLLTLPLQAEYRLVTIISRISGMVGAIPFPLALPDARWLGSILEYWAQGCDPSKERLFALAEQIRIVKTGWGTNDEEAGLPPAR
jgi:hypothetical protein